MRRVAIGLSLAALCLLVLPAGAATSHMTSATLAIPLPNAGDASMAEAVIRLQGAKVKKALGLTPTVLNAKQVGKDVVVIAAVRQEAKDRNRFDVTAAVLRRGVRATSVGHTESAPRIGFRCPRSVKKCSSKTYSSLLASNVVQGNAVPTLRFDCGFGTASFLLGSRTGFPAAGDTVADGCGLWLDQVWMPQSFAAGIGANWCAVPVDPPAGAVYTFHFNCNFATRGAALEDPLKAATILGVVPDSGSCPRVNSYTFVCPQEQGASGTLEATFSAPLHEGFEFGFGASTDGLKINQFFPSRVIDESKAGAIIDALMTKYGGDVDSGFNEAATFIRTNKNAEACRVLRHLEDIYSQHITTTKWGDQGFAAFSALTALDCNTR